MVVRFLPAPEERPAAPHEERDDLAEVIEFRTRLRRPVASGQRSAASEHRPAASEHRPAVSEHTRTPVRAEPESKPVFDAPVADRVMTLRQLIERDGSANSDSASDDAGEAELAKAELAEAATAEEVADAEGSAPKDEPSAQETAIKLLARKAISSGELRRALVAAGHPELDAEQAVAECAESLYLDDDALAQAVTRKLRQSKGESRARIRQKLRERLLPDAAIETALAELDDDEEAVLLRQTAEERARRMSGLDRQTAERRLLGFLARRGWTGERATRAVREALDARAAR